MNVWQKVQIDLAPPQWRIVGNVPAVPGSQGPSGAPGQPGPPGRSVAPTNLATGTALIVLPDGVNLATTDIAASAGAAYLTPIIVGCPMLVSKLGFQVTTGASGTNRWGLFDFASKPSAATLLAGGQGVLNSTGYQTIANSAGYATIPPGGYVLIVTTPAANSPSWRRSTMASSSIPCTKFYDTTYTWSDTPDITSSHWSTDTVTQNFILHGLLGPGTNW